MAEQKHVESEPQTLARANRSRTPPLRLAPATLPEYSLALLQSSRDTPRMLRAVRRVSACSEWDAASVLVEPLPAVIRTELTYREALRGQFEFICCDAIAVIVRSEVVVTANRGYLSDIYARVRQSPEFAEVAITLRDLPRSPAALKFLDQFLGMGAYEVRDAIFPFRVVGLHVMRKKARHMARWARRASAVVECDELGE